MGDRDWWHGTRAELHDIRPYLHVGTMEQAQMRGGRGCTLVRMQVTPTRVLRRRDLGQWRERDLRTAASRGYDAIVYLNRYEGIPLEEFDRAREIHDIDALDDARFRRALPSCRDSLIVLNPEIARPVVA